MRARFLSLLLAACAVALHPGASGSTVLGSGHIAAGNPMADTRSITVLSEAADRPGLPPLSQEARGIDGFFIRPAPPAGTKLSTLTEDRSGNGFAININFHSDQRILSGTRVWVGGCSPGWFLSTTPPQVEVVDCTVPGEATSVEVSSDWGRDLFVTVFTN